MFCPIVASVRKQGGRSARWLQLSPAGRFSNGPGRGGVQSSRDFWRMSLNSFGPLISLRLRSWRSSSVADGSLRRSTSCAAISDALAALFVSDSLRRVVSRPNSTSRRMASGRARLSLCLAVQASRFSRNSDERRMVVRASFPVVRRPPLFSYYGFSLRGHSFPFFSPPTSTDPGRS